MMQLPMPVHVGMHQQRPVSFADSHTAICSAEEAAGHQADDLQDQVAASSARSCRCVLRNCSVPVVLCCGPFANLSPAWACADVCSESRPALMAPPAFPSSSIAGSLPPCDTL